MQNSGRDTRDALGTLALSADIDILSVYEACTKFPTGGMYATLAQE